MYVTKFLQIYYKKFDMLKNEPDIYKKTNIHL